MLDLRIAMHVIFVNLSYPVDATTPEALLERFRNLEGWAEGVAGAGSRATVVQRFFGDANFERDGIQYDFVADHPLPGASRSSLVRVSRRALGPDLRAWQVPGRVHEHIVDLCRRDVARAETVVVHLNGLMYGLQARLLRRSLPSPVPIVLQHHAEGPWPGVRGIVQRWTLNAVDGFIFASRAQGEPWLRGRLIHSPSQVFEVMEGSTRFGVQGRAAARRATGMAGAPVFLWVGRLNANKDPLTVLAGFERALDHLPASRLVMAFSGSPELLPQVQARISGSPALAPTVHCLGTLAYDEMEQVYNSADYFVLGSHHEGSGFALVEAMACGVVPIVTDIPSFRMITDGGRIGALWQTGDPRALAAAIVAATGKPWAEESAEARRYFDRRLSFSAIGREAVAVYQEVAARRRRQ